MLSESLRKRLRPIGLLLTIQWFAMVVATFIYAGVLYYFDITAWQHDPSTPPTTPLHTFLPVMAVVAGLVSLTFFRRIGSDEQLRRALKDEVPLDQLNQLLPRPSDAGGESGTTPLTPFERRQLKLAHSLRTQLTFCWAMNEAVAILGLILAFLAKDAPMFLPYGVASLVLQVVAFPRLEATITRTTAWQHEFQI